MRLLGFCGPFSPSEVAFGTGRYMARRDELTTLQVGRQDRHSETSARPHHDDGVLVPARPGTSGGRSCSLTAQIRVRVQVAATSPCALPCGLSGFPQPSGGRGWRCGVVELGG